MIVDFEKLNKIEEIHKILLLIKEDTSNQIERRWLTTDRLADYIGYSERSIKKFIKDGELELGVHFYQKGKKNLFDKREIDKWIIDGSEFDSDMLAEHLVKNIA